MSRVYGAADWTDLAVTLIHEGDREVVLTAVAGARPPFSPAHAALAGGIICAEEDRLVELLGPVLGLWTYVTGRMCWGTCIAEDWPQHTYTSLNRPLHVPDDLRRLPLLELAEASARADGDMVIADAPGLPWHGGAYRAAATVLVGGEPVTVRLIELRDTTVAVFAHELAHALDPHARTCEEGERFADLLGGLLNEHRPATLAEALPLIEEAERGVSRPVMLARTRDRDAQQPAHTASPRDELTLTDLPEPGAESLFVFSGLPISHALPRLLVR